MLADGQKEVSALTYSPLPAEVVSKEQAQIDKVQ